MLKPRSVLLFLPETSSAIGWLFFTWVHGGGRTFFPAASSLVVPDDRHEAPENTKQGYSA